jgi:PAS domain S-box-containing protein
MYYRVSEGRSTGVVLDVTERKQSENALAWHAAIVESSDDAIIGKTLEGVVTSWNRGAERMFGYSAQEMVGRLIYQLIPPERTAEEAKILETIRSGGYIHHFETVRQRKDGQRIDVSVTTSPIRDAQGRVVGASKIARDITAKKRAQAQIETLNADLEQRVMERTAELEEAVQQMEAFSYSVSHDLRAPLRHIRGFAEILQENAGASLDEESRSVLKKVFLAATRMQTLINDLLEFSRVQRAVPTRQKVEMGMLLKGVIEDLSPDLKGRNVEWRIGALPAVEADAGLIRQVWVNLVSNALKFTKGREPATIEVGICTGNGASPTFFVRDNGAGFDMKFAAKLFGVFQRLHKESDFEGTGIGLANVQKIVQRHGGRIWAEAAPNQGATFFFTLGSQSKEVGDESGQTMAGDRRRRRSG